MKQIDFSRNLVKIHGNILRLVSETTVALLWEGETPGGGKFWEVWRVRIRKENKTLPSGKALRSGQLIPPSNEEFGTHAWAFYSMPRAEDCLRRLDVSTTKIAA